MKVKKLVKNISELLSLDDFSDRKKRKALKKLLKKLKKREESMKSKLKSKLSEKEKLEIKDELTLIKYHLKKSKKILAKLEKED